MKPSALTFPGYQINEYLGLISPDQPVYDKVLSVKEIFSNEYQAENARWGKPHITSFNCLQYAMNEGRMVNRLKTIVAGHCPFRVELRDFGCFPPHTIYANVVNKEPFREMLKTIRSYRDLFTFNNTHPPQFSDDPHMIIAGRMNKLQYDKAWQQYSQMHFNGEFIATSMLLLRRRVGVEKKFQLVVKIDFMGLHADAVQDAQFS